MSRLEEFAKGQEIKVFPSGREAEIAEQNTGKREPRYKRLLRKVAMMTTGLALINATLIGTPAFAQEQKDDNKNAPKTEQVVTPAMQTDIVKQQVKIPKNQEEMQKFIRDAFFKGDNLDVILKNKEDAKSAISIASAAMSLTYSETGVALLHNAFANGYKLALMPEGKNPEGSTVKESKLIYLRSDQEWVDKYKNGDLPESQRKAIEHNYTKDFKGKPYEQLDLNGDGSKRKTEIQKATVRAYNFAAITTWHLAHELRHVWQLTTPNLETDVFKADHDTAYNVRSMLTINRTLEADADAVAALTCWELSKSSIKNKNGNIPFDLMENNEDRAVLPKAFRAAMNKTGSAEEATRAAFNAWNEVTVSDKEGNKSPLRDEYDNSLVSKFTGVDYKEKFFGEADINWNFIKELDQKDFAKKLKIPMTSNSYIETNDINFKPLNKTAELALDLWFNAYKAYNKLLNNDKKADESYKIDRQEMPSKDLKHGSTELNQQKYANKDYDRKIMVALKRNGRV